MQPRYLGYWRNAVLALLLALLVSACGTVREAGVPSGMPTLPAKATQLEQSGDFAGAAQAYLDAAQTARAPRLQQLQLHAAAAWIRAGRNDQAKRILDAVDTGNLAPVWTARKQVVQAQLALAENQPERALQLLPEPSDQFPPALQRQNLQLRAEAFQAAGNLLESARARVQLDPLLSDPSAIEQNRRAIWGTLNGLSANALQQLRTAPPPDVLSGWMELAYIMKQATLHPEQLQSDLESWRARYPDHPADQLLGQILAQHRQFQQRPQHIALLLPLSGSLADAAATIRDGFLAAYYSHGGDARRTSVRIYDTAAPDANIWSLYSEALRNGADFIVGPLNKTAVTTLAKADRLQVPVLALNFTDDQPANATAVNPGAGSTAPTPGVAPDPDQAAAEAGAAASPKAPPANFYQFSLAPEDEARQVAERASLEGMIRAVALVPEGDWGDRLLNAFSTRFQQLGGEVLDAERYNVSNSDFSQPIRRMLNLDESRARYNMLRRITGKDIEFQPRRRQDVDFVFVAGFPRQARLIVPQLRFYHAAGLPVYATSHVYSGTPDPRDDEDMDGLVFCDMPWVLEQKGDLDPLHQQIASLWPQNLERFARLYAFGIDAFNVIPYLQWLHQEPYERLAGETGSLYMGADNRIHRSLEWARFIDGLPAVIQQDTAPAAVHAGPAAPDAGSGNPGTAAQPPAPAAPDAPTDQPDQ